MLISNYHTHTKRCNHAEGEDRDYVDKAIAAGLTELGFSDHTPYIGFPDGYYSSFRMRPNVFPEYIDSISRLKNEYKDKIIIHAGLEAEYYPDLFNALLDYIRSYNLDYLILGQHFTHNETDGDYTGYPCTEKVLAEYCEQVCYAIKTGFFSYVAHPDIISFKGDNKIYRREMEMLCRCAKEENIPLEFNLLGFRTGRSYPNIRFFEIAADMGNQIIMGSDAHDPNVFLDSNTVIKAENTLTSLGIKPIKTLHLKSLQ